MRRMYRPRHGGRYVEPSGRQGRHPVPVHAIPVGTGQLTPLRVNRRGALSGHPWDLRGAAGQYASRLPPSGLPALAVTSASTIVATLGSQGTARVDAGGRSQRTLPAPVGDGGSTR